ncbi:MAG: thioredoxin domain-containing protein, partial [Eubacteriales bacterium]|nr:thioredoxin domain-containing protein [Eubacteriales bacterium]
MTKNAYGSAPGRSTGMGAMLFVVFAMILVLPFVGNSAELFLTSFGDGKVKVRLYTDYFCPPCRDMEPGIEPLISELVKNGTVTLTFVDTPFYRYSSLYARHFLYAINEKKDLEHALHVRRSLIEATRKNLDSAETLEAFLNEKKIALKPFDPRTTFDVLSRHLKEDTIDATPSCVIEMEGSVKKYNGAGNITDALGKLK